MLPIGFVELFIFKMLNQFQPIIKCRVKHRMIAWVFQRITFSGIFTTHTMFFMKCKFDVSQVDDRLCTTKSHLYKDKDQKNSHMSDQIRVKLLSGVVIS